MQRLNFIVQQKWSHGYGALLLQSKRPPAATKNEQIVNTQAKSKLRQTNTT